MSRAHFLHSLAHEFFQTLDLEKKSALTALAWGVWVAAFRSFSSAPAFAYFVLVARTLHLPGAPEYWWGALLMATGSLQLYGLFAGITWLRMGAAILACTVWLALGAAFVIYVPRGTAAPVYGMFALANAALYYQVGTARRR